MEGNIGNPKELSGEALLQAYLKCKAEIDMLSKTVVGGVAKMVLDNGLKIVTASDGYFAMTGYSREESHEPPFLDRGTNLVVEEDQPYVVDAAMKLMATNEPASISYRIRKKDGSIAWNTAHCAKVDHTENGLSIDIFFMDTTEVKNAERQMTSLLNNVPGGVIQAHVGQDIQVDFANDEFYRQIGYTKEEFIADLESCYSNLVHSEDRGALLTTLREIDAVGASSSTYYRIETKLGETRWMRVRASRLSDELEVERVVQGIITDVTEEREQQLQKQVDEERFRIISEYTRDTLFDWNLETDEIECSPMYEKMFGFAPPPRIRATDLLAADLILEEDKPVLAGIMEKVHRGEPFAEGDYRSKRADGTYFWCRNRVSVIFDGQKRPVRAVGVLSDVDEFRRTTTALQNKAMQDSLTGLLNRMSMESQVAERLEKCEPGQVFAYLQFDIDHFKQINDFMGHSAGDQVLILIADLLREWFPGGTVVGRMGGDEFAVLIAVTEQEGLMDRLEGLREHIHRDFQSGDKIYPLSVSIGLSYYPTDGGSFQELYERADTALYRSKHCGGNCLFVWEKG